MTSIAAVRRRSSLAGSPAGRLRADPTAAWRHLDLVLVGCLVAISAIGVLMVYSATRGPGGGEPIDQTYLKRQLMFVAIGFVILIVTAAIDYGAGDNTYGAIFEAGKTRPAVQIHDGDLAVL